MTEAQDEEAADHLAWEAKMQAQIDRLKAELRQYRQALDGYAIVPVEPTAAMLKAAQTAWSHDAFKRTSTLWKAMIAAAGETK
jgi:hypothetical protein